MPKLQAMNPDRPSTTADRMRVLEHLLELISALDGRAPQIERAGEITIAHDARVLRKKAVERIAELEAREDSLPAAQH